MKIKLILTLAGLFLCNNLMAQIKIGDNPQNIDASSVLELESSTRALVITRVSDQEMNAMVPLQGALVYNNDAQCIFYFDGTEWKNLCESQGGNLTADPIVNPVSTIVLTENGDNINIEVGLDGITGDNIQDFSILGDDIAGGVINSFNLANNSVGSEELQTGVIGDDEVNFNDLTLSDFNNDAGFITGADLDIASQFDQITITGDGTAGNLFEVADGSIDNTKIADGSINSQQIINGTIMGIDIAPQSIQPGNIQTGNANEVLQTNAAGTAVVWAPLPGASAVVVDGTTITGTGLTGSPLMVPTNGITTTQIDNGTIATADIANNAITSVKIGNGEVGTADIANDAITTVKILDDNVTPEKIAPGTDGQFLSTSGTDVVWVDLPPGGGSTEVADQATITGIGTPGDPFKIEPSATDGQFLSTVGGNVAWADLPPGGGGAVFDPATISGSGTAVDPYTIADDGISTIKVLDANITPAKIEPSATDGQFLTTTGGNVAWADLPPSGGSAVFDPATISGSGTGADPYTVADDAITTIKILDNNVTPDKIEEGTDGDVLTTDAAGDVVWAPAPSAHTGITNSIFFAGDDGGGTGAPIFDDDSFFWDPTERFNTGALFIGLDGGPKSTGNTGSKVHIMENVAGNVGFGPAYPLQIQNRATLGTDSDGSATGLLFSVNNTTAFGKGALVYERKTNSGRGDFHILQDIGDDDSNPLLTDAVVTVQNDGDVGIGITDPLAKLHVNGNFQLAEQFIDETGNAGNVGDVLTATATGTEWAAPSAGAVETGTTIDGNGTTGNVLELADNAVTTEKINNSAILAEDLNDMGATDGQVLKWDDTTTAWVPSADDGTAPVDTDPNDGLSDFSGVTGYDLNVDDTTIELAADAIQIKDGGVNSAKIADASIEAADLNDMGATDGQVLKWDNATTAWVPSADTGSIPTGTLGSIFFSDGAGGLLENATNLHWDDSFGTGGALGIGTNSPSNKLHVAGAIRAEGILNSDGVLNEPSYRFSSDTDTGMYHPAADQIGIVVGEQEAIRIRDEGTTDSEVVVNGSLELTEQLLDETGNAGTTGQVLTSTGTGTAWANNTGTSPVVAMGKVDAPATAENAQGATVVNNIGGDGNYTVTFSTPMPDADYIIQLTTLNAGHDTKIEVTTQTAAFFVVQVYQIAVNPVTSDITSAGIDAEWYFTVLDF